MMTREIIPGRKTEGSTVSSINYKLYKLAQICSAVSEIFDAQTK